MFIRNLLKECNTALHSIMYLTFIVALLAIFFTQYWADAAYDLQHAQKGILFEDTRWGATDNNPLVRPSPNEENYGRVEAEQYDQIRRNVAYVMYRNISSNKYQTYVLGLFYKEKSFNEKKQQRAKEIFKEITGGSYNEVRSKFYEMDLAKVLELWDVSEEEAADYLKNKYYKELNDEFTPNHATSLLYDYEEYMPVNKQISDEEFIVLVDKFKTLIGGKTLEYERLMNFSSAPATYESSLERYNSLVDDDKVSGAYARLFCDYLGVVVGIAPTFIAAAIAMREIRRRKYEMLADNTTASSVNIIAARFSAIVIVVFVPVFLLAFVSAISLANGVKPLNLTIDNLAFIKYSIVWLLPTIMFSAAVGLFFTELTKTPAGIVVQFIIWLYSAWFPMDTDHYMIKYGANMFIRHNVVGDYQTYISHINEIMFNRISYTMIAILLIFAAMLIRKRNNLRNTRWNGNTGQAGTNEIRNRPSANKTVKPQG